MHKYFLVLLLLHVSNAFFTLQHSKCNVGISKTSKSQLLTLSASASGASDTFKNQPSVQLIGESNNIKKTPDFLAAISYFGATAVEFSLIMVFLHGLQITAKKITAKFPEVVLSTPGSIVTKIGLGLFFFFMSVRSRVFSPLDNSRPSASKQDPNFKRKTPNWMPPPLAFPIIWSSIALLRAISSVLVVTHTKTLLSPAIFSFFLHLSVGDTWNTINNQEKRLGTAVLGVLAVWSSVVYAVKQYYTTFPLAGKLLAPSAVWISVATVLVTTIWRLNYEDLGRPSLFPSKEEGPTCKWRLPFTSLNS